MWRAYDPDVTIRWVRSPIGGTPAPTWGVSGEGSNQHEGVDTYEPGDGSRVAGPKGERDVDTNILVVDGHHIVREGLACLLSRMEGVASVAQAASGEEALRIAKEGGNRYEVVVFDLVLEGILHGIDLAAAFRRELPETRLIALSADRRRAMVEAALQAGASAYVTKSDTLDALKAAITAVREGRTYLAPELAAVTNGNGNGNGHRETGPSLRLLSPRERQVLTLIARGGTTKSIASDLGISPKTVEKHRGKLARKLDIHSVAELTRFAIENELA